MKRFIAVVIVMISIMSLSGCNSTTENTDNLSEILAEHEDSNSYEESAVGLDEIIAGTYSSTDNSEEYSNIADTEKHDNIQNSEYSNDNIITTIEEIETDDEVSDPTFTDVDILSMMEELNSNAYRAKQIYLNKQVRLTGYIFNFDANGEYIILNHTNTNIYDPNHVYFYRTYVSDEKILGQHRTIIQMIIRNRRAFSECISTLKCLLRRTESSCQTRSVSQNQVYQSKHHIQFCSLFSQTSIACLSISKLFLDYCENVFNLCPYR